jgi:hypothetical protein
MCDDCLNCFKVCDRKKKGGLYIYKICMFVFQL